MFFFGKKAVKEEGKGEELQGFLQSRGFKNPSGRITQEFFGKDGQQEGFEEAGGQLWKYAIARPIINVVIKADEFGRDMDRGRHEQLVLDPYLDHYIDKYSREGFHTPSGNPIRQSPQAFILETATGHSSLIVTCKNRVFGIGLIMSGIDEYPTIENISKTYLDKVGEYVAKKVCKVEPLEDEHVVIATSPDAAFNIFDERRSSKTILYGGCTIKVALDFTREYADNLLQFLNQSGRRETEAKWIYKQTRDDHTKMIDSVEILTNILYKAVNSTLGLTPEYSSLNCANLMEIIFSGQISAGYGIAHPSTVHSLSHSGPVTAAAVLSAYRSDSQGESQPPDGDAFGLIRKTTRRKKRRQKKSKQEKNKKSKRRIRKKKSKKGKKGKKGKKSRSKRK